MTLCVCGSYRWYLLLFDEYPTNIISLPLCIKLFFISFGICLYVEHPNIQKYEMFGVLDAHFSNGVKPSRTSIMVLFNTCTMVFVTSAHRHFSNPLTCKMFFVTYITTWLSHSMNPFCSWAQGTLYSSLILFSSRNLLNVPSTYSLSLSNLKVLNNVFSFSLNLL